MAQATGSPRKRRKEARPAELTTAAMALFAERGYAATRLEDIAQRAGVSKGTLYLYFSSKEALFKAVIEEGILPVLVAGHAGSAFELLAGLIATWWRSIGETPFSGVPKLMMAEAGNFPEVAIYYHDQVIRRGRALMTQVLERGVATGEFRPLSVESYVDVVISPILMLAIWRHSSRLGGEPEPRSFLPGLPGPPQARPGGSGIIQLCPNLYIS